jgi:putative SOS response-associated peptidase YedK
MCGRYTLSSAEKRRLQSRFATRGRLEFSSAARHNIAPAQQAPVLVVEDGHLAAKEMTWGFRPAWSKVPLINAQQESLMQKPSFRDAFAQRRCLVPADGFYEWRHDGPRRTPIRFVLPDRTWFCFAGIWERNPRDAGGCYVIITMEAGGVVRPVHARMPVLVRPEDYDAWLDPHPDAAMLEGVLRHARNDELTAYAVGPAVNNIRNDGPECIEPWSDNQLSMDGLFPGCPSIPTTYQPR